MIGLNELVVFEVINGKFCDGVVDLKSTVEIIEETICLANQDY